MRSIMYLVTMFFLLVACSGKRKNTELEKWLPDPEEILARKADLGLSNAQQKAIEDRYRNARKKYDSLQFVAMTETRRLEDIVRKHPVNPDSARMFLDQLLATESQLKMLRLDVYVFSRNQLTEDQFSTLLRTNAK